MADLDTIFPDHGDAPHEDHNYVPGESLEIDGPAPGYQRVILHIVALKAESTYALVTQDVVNDEYDFVLRGEYTNVFPTDSTVEDAALAYEIRGEKEGEANVCIQVGWLLTEPPAKDEHAQSQEETGSGESQTQDSGGQSSETGQP